MYVCPIRKLVHGVPVGKNLVFVRSLPQYVDIHETSLDRPRGRGSALNIRQNFDWVDDKKNNNKKQ